MRPFVVVNAVSSFLCSSSSRMTLNLSLLLSLMSSISPIKRLSSRSWRSAWTASACIRSGPEGENETMDGKKLNMSETTICAGSFRHASGRAGGGDGRKGGLNGANETEWAGVNVVRSGRGLSWSETLYHRTERKTVDM